MGWGSDPPKPDPRIGESQDQLSDLAVRQQDFYEQNIAPRVLDQMDQQIDISKRVADTQLGLVTKYDQRYWDTTAKYQDKFYADVDKYSSADEQERTAGMARSDISQALQMAQQQQGRGMSRMGINPNSGAYQTASRKSATEGALAQAGASTMARQAAKELGMRYTGAAAGMNGQLIGATQGAAGGALTAGAAGLGAIGAAAGISASQLGAQSGAHMGAGQLGASMYNTQMQGWGAQSNQEGEMLGTVATLAAMYFSDKRLKTDIEKVGTREDGLGVYDYNYVWGGPRQRGLMAHEVKKKYPDAVKRLGKYDAVDYSKVGG